MGSEINLNLGAHAVDWAKNGTGQLHGALFQNTDLGEAPYHYVDDNGAPIVEIRESAVRPLSAVTPRLELLGFTLRTATALIAHALTIASDSAAASLSFVEATSGTDADVTRMFVRHANVMLSAAEWPELPPDEFVYRFVQAFISDQSPGPSPADEPRFSGIYEVLGDLAPYSILRVLAEDARFAHLNVTWNFADVVENGWVERRRIIEDLGRVRPFIVVTEGHSDAKVIKQALIARQPDVADFFRFVDMEQGYPFSGTGNLYKFCQGLVSIGIENNVVIVYDNDAAGWEKYEDAKTLSMPANMRAIVLPVLDVFRSFKTIGPGGTSYTDINQRAASIECYLDLEWNMHRTPTVRWGGYNRKTCRYQGELEHKQDYVRQVLELKQYDGSYSYSKLDAILGELMSAAIAIAEADVLNRNLPYTASR